MQKRAPILFFSKIKEIFYSWFNYNMVVILLHSSTLVPRICVTSFHFSATCTSLTIDAVEGAEIVAAVEVAPDMVCS